MDLGQIREKYRVGLDKAQRIAENVQEDLRPVADTAILVGSIRRRRPVVADVEFVVLPDDLEQFHRRMVDLGFEAGSKRRKYTGIMDGVKVELYVAFKPEELGALTLAYTGDYLMNVAMRSKAKRMGYKMDQYGIWKGKKVVLQSPDERDFFDFLGMDYHWPEERSLAARSELDKIARELLRRDLAPDERRFVLAAREELKENKWLPPEKEAALRSLAERKPVRAELGALELVELGIAVPNGLPGLSAQDLGGLWQALYEKATGNDGTVRQVIVQAFPGRLQYWVEVEEDGAIVYYLAAEDTWLEDEPLPSEEELLVFAGVALAAEDVDWTGPFPGLPEAG